jgi:hypothetical protein
MPPQIRVIENVTFDLNGERCHRVVTDINGHDVTVIQYDESPQVMVVVDHSMRMMDISNVGKYVERRVEE